MVTTQRKVPVFHAHGCLGCGRRYADTCRSPLANGRCNTCRLGHPPSVTDLNREPRACCKEDSKLVTDNETLNRYNLGGPGPWWLCRTCSRTQPRNPKEHA